MNRVAVQTEYLSDLIEEFWLLTSGRAGHIISSVNDALKSVDNEHRAKLPETPAVITLSGQNVKLITG